MRRIVSREPTAASRMPVRTTIYERCGGFPVVRRLISEFYDRALDSPLLAHHFEDIEMPRLIDHQARFFAFLMGGPASYSDDHLARVHARLRITHEEFAEMVELLQETLEDFDLSEPDIDTIANELQRREHIIVTRG